MRAISLIAFLLLLSASIAVADPCLPGTLQTYAGLGPGGCTVGSTLFSDFELLPLLPGAVAISPLDITVVPQDQAFGSALRFDLSQDAGPAEILQAFFQYNVSNGPFLAKQLSMTGSSASGDGVVTVVEELCPGGSVDSCLVAPEVLILFDIGIDSLTSEQALFSPANFLGVRLDITIDGGLAGTAGLNRSVTNAHAVVPEPATITMTLSGLVALLFLTRRGRRRST